MKTPIPKCYVCAAPRVDPRTGEVTAIEKVGQIPLCPDCKPKAKPISPMLSKPPNAIRNPFPPKLDPLPECQGYPCPEASPCQLHRCGGADSPCFCPEENTPPLSFFPP